MQGGAGDIHASAREESVKCEGMRRRGGAFTLGPVEWEQCSNDAIVMLKVKQDDGTGEFPGCDACWRECRETKGMKVLEARPLTDAERKKP